MLRPASQGWRLVYRPSHICNLLPHTVLRCSTSSTMTKETTPPPDTAAAAVHEPPSLPASPLPKRTKTTEPESNSSIASVMAPSASNGTAVTSISQPQPPLMVKKLVESATAPTRGSAFAAGYDIYSAKETVIPAKGKGLVDTGLAIAVPEGTYGRIAPRSGLASKNFIDTGAGVIDADYRGEVKVLLFNFSDVDFTIKQGDRIAQLVLERIYTPDVLVVEQLEESVRGAGGFGSTGK
ncbi:dUTP pyrophosphatase [Talaromyces islandicus]|uniref:Deoxyuridine 5'-triphosphate nucleotidohydrolase n=1 Tax=Talaromyces islandicus TaxID=28573 RepID=A0A0U1MAZ1_TALIS|nr:dUTP pyrophosphatase [Talaromyces islandicus]